MILKKSFTFLEVLLSAFILAIAFGGLIAAFVSSRALVLRSGERLMSANVGRQVLDTIYADVVATTTAPTWSVTAPGAGVANLEYNATETAQVTYTITSVAPSASCPACTQVDMRMDYTLIEK